MKTRSIALLLVVAACAAPSRGQEFIAFLDGNQEIPPFATPGTGVGTASYDPLTQMLSVDLSYSDLLGETTNAHIHCCAPDSSETAGIAIHFIPAGFITGNTSGSFMASFDLSMDSTYDAGFLTASGGTAAQARDRLLGAMTNGVADDMNIAYFNIHTSERPPGEIRGNIRPVPEPSSVLLVVGAALGVVGMRRRL